MSNNRSGCRSCLFYLLCIAAGMLLIVGVAAYFGYRKFVAFRDQYTGANPAALPVVRYTKPELEALQKRMDQFFATPKPGQTNGRLELSANDLNLLIATSAFSNRVYVAMQSNAVSGQFSLPLSELGLPLFRGRYLNGSGTLNVGRVDGKVEVTLREASVNGIAIPGHYLNQIRRQNLAEGVVLDEKAGRIRRIAVENGRLIMESGPAAEAP
jgi:hypothetical protein